jgi:hypothetical protein
MKQGVKMENVHGLIERIQVDIQNEKSEEEIFQFLLPHLGRDPKFDGQVAESMAMIAHVKIAKVLRKMLQVSNDKKVQKIIKRSLYRLKGKGIAIEEVQPRKEESILQPLKTEPPRGFGNGYDMAWNRFLLLSLPHAGRGLTVLHGLISDTEGLLDFSGAEISRKEFKGFFEEVQKGSPTPLVQMEPSYVGFLFDQAYRLTLKKGGVPSEDYLHLKGEVERMKQEYARPFIYGLLQADEIAGDDRILTRGGELVKADLFHGWRIEEDLVRPFADEVWEAEESKIVLNQAQKEARFQGIYQKALSELFSGERRLQYKRRLEEMAYLLLQLKREEEARVSLAVAVDLEKPLNLIQPNPFLFQLVIKSIFAVLAEAYEKKVKEPSLIVKP